MDFIRIFVSFVCSNPPNVSHIGIDSLYLELILQNDWQSMKGAPDGPMSAEVVIKLLCSLYSLIKKNLVEAIILVPPSQQESNWKDSRLSVDLQEQLSCSMTVLLVKRYTPVVVSF